MVYLNKVNRTRKGPLMIMKKIFVFLWAIKILSTLLSSILFYFSIGSLIISLISSYIAELFKSDLAMIIKLQLSYRISYPCHKTWVKSCQDSEEHCHWDFPKVFSLMPQNHLSKLVDLLKFTYKIPSFSNIKSSSKYFFLIGS
jgi:hypothetical protein